MTESETPAAAPAGEQAQQQAPAAYAKAAISKRVIAVIIDAVLVIPVWLVFYMINLAALGGLVTMGYSFLKDGIDFGGLDNRSVGKKIMGLRVMNLSTGQRCNYVDSLLRQILFIIPILNILIAVVELVLVVVDDKGVRLGDKIAKTMVIEEA